MQAKHGQPGGRSQRRGNRIELIRQQPGVVSVVMRYCGQPCLIQHPNVFTLSGGHRLSAWGGIEPLATF